MANRDVSAALRDPGAPVAAWLRGAPWPAAPASREAFALGFLNLVHDEARPPQPATQNDDYDQAFPSLGPATPRKLQAKRKQKQRQRKRVSATLLTTAAVPNAAFAPPPTPPPPSTPPPSTPPRAKDFGAASPFGQLSSPSHSRQPPTPPRQPQFDDDDEQEEDDEEAGRMADVFAAILTQRLAPSTLSELHLLARLAAAPAPAGQLPKQLARRTLARVGPLLRQLDAPCMRGFARVLRSAELEAAAAALEAVPAELDVPHTASYHVPFNAATDSRNSFSKELTALYQNREHSRDALLLLLRLHHDERNRLGAPAQGWRRTFDARCAELLAALMPVNRAWFADFFVTQLVQAATSDEPDGLAARLEGGGSGDDDGSFFADFVAACDSHALNELLHTLVAARVAQAMQAAAKTKAFADAVLELRALGRFLGVLTFAPNWPSADRAYDSDSLALKEALREAVRAADAAGPPRVDVLGYARAAARAGRLALAVPWIAAMLRALRDDRVSRSRAYYRRTLGALRALLRSPRLQAPGALRLMVAAELEGLFAALAGAPAALAEDDEEEELPPLELEAEAGEEELDADERLFSPRLARRVLPVLADVAQALLGGPRLGRQTSGALRKTRATLVSVAATAAAPERHEEQQLLTKSFQHRLTAALFRQWPPVQGVVDFVVGAVVQQAVAHALAQAVPAAVAEARRRSGGASARQRAEHKAAVAATVAARHHCECAVPDALVPLLPADMGAAERALLARLATAHAVRQAESLVRAQVGSLVGSSSASASASGGGVAPAAAAAALPAAVPQGPPGPLRDAVSQMLAAGVAGSGAAAVAASTAAPLVEAALAALGSGELSVNVAGALAAQLAELWAQFEPVGGAGGRVSALLGEAADAFVRAWGALAAGDAVRLARALVVPAPRLAPFLARLLVRAPVPALALEQQLLAVPAAVELGRLVVEGVGAGRMVRLGCIVAV